MKVCRSRGLLLTLLGVALALGCTSEPSPEPPPPAPVPLHRITLEKNAAPEKNRVKAGEEVVVTGSFELPEGSSSAAVGPIVVKITLPNGTIANSGFTLPKVQGRTVTFERKLKAPPSRGEFKVTAFTGKESIASTNLSVEGK